jgi:hypothetical protein
VALFACFPVFHLTMGISFLASGIFAEIPSDMPPGFPVFMPFFLGLMFVIVPAMIILLGWAFAISMIFAGYFMSQYRHYMYCLVIAALSCAFMPFGTVLGVLSIILLVQPSVKELFGIVDLS